MAAILLLAAPAAAGVAADGTTEAGTRSDCGWWNSIHEIVLSNPGQRDVAYTTEGVHSMRCWYMARSNPAGELFWEMEDTDGTQVGCWWPAWDAPSCWGDGHNLDGTVGIRAGLLDNQVQGASLTFHFLQT